MKKSSQAVRYTALVGMMAASLECAKLALAAIPNVEAVSLLIAIYSYVFGFAGLFSSLVFVFIEPLIWGVGTWFISYLIYWPLLAFVFLMLGRCGIKNRFLTVAAATLMTFVFGILTSLVDIGLFSGSFDNFFYRFGIYYARGAVFYALHIGSNFIIFLFLFPMLRDFAVKIKRSIFK